MRQNCLRAVAKEIEKCIQVDTVVLENLHARFKLLVEDDLDLFLAMVYIHGTYPVLCFEDHPQYNIHMMATALIVEFPDGTTTVLYDLRKHTKEFAREVVKRLEMPMVHNLLASLFVR